MCDLIPITFQGNLEKVFVQLLSSFSDNLFSQYNSFFHSLAEEHSNLGNVMRNFFLVQNPGSLKTCKGQLKSHKGKQETHMTTCRLCMLEEKAADHCMRLTLSKLHSASLIGGQRLDLWIHIVRSTQVCF